MKLQENQLFANRYLLGQKIGIGGFSEVWRAADQYIPGMTLALKIYATERGLDKESIELFSGEYMLTKSLKHKHLVEVIYYDVYQQSPYLVMPFYSNGSLARALHGNEPFTEDHVARLLLEISDALNYLHTQEPAVLHRDIKPDNILIANDGSYILSDFGISRRVRHTIAKHTGKGSEDSMSIAYSAPERFAKFPQTTAASDIFSLGVMLYQVCSGFLPWDENGGIALLRGAEIPDIPTGYSRKLNEIINQCMDPDPDKRPTAAQLKEWSLTYVKEGYWKLNSTVAIEKKPRKNVYVLPILATTVLLLAILFFVLYSREAEVKPIAAEPAKAEQVTENSSDANSEQTDSTLVETDTKPGPTPPANNKTNSDMSSGNTGTGKNKQTKPVPSQGNQTDEKEREVLLEKKRKEQKELEKMLKEEIDQEKKNKSLETN